MPTNTININVSGVGASLLNSTDPSAVRWIRVNVDNTVSYRTAAETLSDIGAQASGSYLLASNNLSDLASAATSRTNLGLGNVENTALSTWAGSTNLTTLGTIGTGTWNATAISKAKGGTGVDISSAALVLGTSSSNAGKLTFANATNAFTQSLQGAVVAADITYNLPTTAPTAGQVLSSTAPSGGVATLSWTTASSGITINSTGITSGGANRFLFENSSNQVSEVATDFYFDNSTTYATVIAPGRSGVITGANNSLFGYDAGGDLTTGADNVVIGYIAANNRTDMLRNVVIGSQATATATMDRGVVIGFGANGATATVSIGGESKNTSQNSVSVGYRAAYGVALGGSHTYSISIGANANLNFAYNSSIAIGYNVGNTATNQGILGSKDANGYISNWYFNGVTHSSAYSVTLNACGGSGTNNAGANMTIAAGKSTGNATPATIILQTSTTGSSGTTLQSLATRLTIAELRVTAAVPVNLKSYTVATLPTGSTGDIAYVTDATAPTYLGALVGGGAVVTPVFYNGAAWVSF